MDVYIVADMEGISGITTIQQVSLGEPEFEAGRRLLAGDVNAAVGGAFDAGATRVVVCDFHDSQRNLPVELMDARAEVEVPHGGLLPGVGPGCAAVLVVGMHAMSGTERGFLEHTCEPTWHRYAVDGVPYGELALIALSAGAEGVPVVFVAGDRAAADEARALLPGVETVTVKEGLAREWCRAVAPEVARAAIRAGTARALRRRAEIAPLRHAFPATVTLEFNRCTGADAFDGRPGVTRRDGFTVSWTARNVRELLPA
jgi:D-amino peptidase